MTENPLGKASPKTTESFHRMLQVLLHADLRWKKNGWGKQQFTRVQDLNRKIYRQKKFRRHLMENLLNPNLSQAERNSIQEGLVITTHTIHSLKIMREKAKEHGFVRL